MSKLNSIINSIIDNIENNINILDKLNAEDNKVNYFEFDKNKLKNIIKKYNKTEILRNQKKKILVVHYGNPYVTGLLCIEAIIKNIEITIGITDGCYGINMAIINIVNNALKEYRMNLQICLKNNILEEEIIKEHFEKVICLGNSNSYGQFRKLENINVEYEPLFDIILYYDSEDYYYLSQDIVKFQMQNFFEIEVFDDVDEFKDIIYIAKNSGRKFCATILSKNKEKCEQFKMLDNFQVICVNENPFKYFELKLPENIF